MVNKPIRTLAIQGAEAACTDAPDQQDAGRIRRYPGRHAGAAGVEALSKGVIDGAVIPYEVVPAVKVQELVSTTARRPVAARRIYLGIHLCHEQGKVRQSVAGAQKVIDANSGAATSAWIGKVFGEADVPGRKLSEKNTFNTIAGAELEAMKKAAQPVIDDWVKDVTAKGANGKALLESARSLIQKYTK